MESNGMKLEDIPVRFLAVMAYLEEYARNPKNNLMNEWQREFFTGLPDHVRKKAKVSAKQYQMFNKNLEQLFGSTYHLLFNDNPQWVSLPNIIQNKNVKLQLKSVDDDSDLHSNSTTAQQMPDPVPPPETNEESQTFNTFVNPAKAFEKLKNLMQKNKLCVVIEDEIALRFKQLDRNGNLGKELFTIPK